MKGSKDPTSQGGSGGTWGRWFPAVFVMILTVACVNGQDIATCCDKAVGACRSVCEKMSLVEVSASSTIREERIYNIHKFCAPHLIEFWICMNQTIQAVVLGSEWWGRSCCALAASGPCRAACVTSRDARGLAPPCRRSDEMPLFDCVQRQQEGQWCCSLTQSLTCHEACQAALWQSNNGHIESTLREKAIEACEQSPPLLQCLRDLTVSTVHADAARYLPCCRESPSQECRSACESVLRRTGESQLIAEGLSQACGAPVIHDALWQCFLRMDSPVDNKDLIPHDAAKLHCCHKAVTINCRRSCFSTFTAGWHHNWQKFHAECLADPQEITLAQCVEEVEAPCSLGCSGLTYCSHLNDRQTSLFRSCTRQADLDAHLAVAEQRDTGRVHIAGMLLPLRNTTHCTSEVWKGIACALHVKPCTPKGHSSVLCMSECMRLVSTCVDWSKAGGLTAAELCGRLSPRHTDKPCLTTLDYIPTNTRSPPLLTSHEVVTSPCINAQCNATQVCRVNRNCVHSGVCKKYTCVDGCPLGDDSPHIVPIGSWARIPMTSPTQKACFKICRCGPKGLVQCQPLPCVAVENCITHDKTILHGEKYYMECNPCACYLGERVCGRRACGHAALLSGLPCNCPHHHVPVRTHDRHYPNVCLAKCAGASDADIEFVGTGISTIGVGTMSKGAICLPAPRACLSNLQTHCPQHYCVNTSNCNMQPSLTVCDTDGRTHSNPCHLIMSGRRFAYWGECLQRCSGTGHVCGVNGITYLSECAAWSEFASVDYLGPCLAVGPVSDKMEPKCRVDRIPCPKLIRTRCTGFTAPGACCPKCGGAIRILFSKKQIDRALYGTNVSSSVINLKNLLKSLERYVQIAECALRGYLTIEQEIFVSIESVLEDPTDLQLHVCILEAEKIADLINRESALISSDLGLSSLSYALIVHSQPTNTSSSVRASILVILVSVFTYMCSS